MRRYFQSFSILEKDRAKYQNSILQEYTTFFTMLYATEMNTFLPNIPKWLANSQNYYIFVADLAGYCIFVNETLKKAFAKTVENIAELHSTNIIHDFDVEAYKQIEISCLQNPETPFQIKLRKKITENTQQEQWISWEISSFKDLSGKVSGLWAIGHDVTIQNQINELKNLSLIAQNTSNIVIITDTNRKITWVNEVFTNITGYTLEEAKGKTPGQLLQFEKTNPETIKLIRKKLNNKEGVRFEILNKGKNNNVYWLDVEIQPLKDELDNFIGFMAIESDITAKKQAEQLAHTRQSQLLATLDNTPNVAIQWYNEQGIVLSWNPASEVLYGWSAKEAVGKTLDQLIHTKEDAQAFLDILQQIKKTQQPYGPYETPAYHRDGTAKWVLATTFHIPLEFDTVGFVCMDVDITAQKKAEQELIESKEKYKSVVSAVAEGLVVQNVEDKILMANQAASNILGLTMDQLLGKDSYDPHWKALHEDGTPFKPEEHPSMITLKTGQSVDNVIMNVHTQKGRKIISINTRPLYNYKGKMYGAVASFTDITEQKEAEQKLKASETLLRASMEASLEAILLLEALKNEKGQITDFIIKDLNLNAAQLLQSSREELLGKSLLKNCNLYFDEVRFEQFKQVMQTETAIEEEFFMQTGNAHEGWYYQQIVNMPAGVAIYSRSINERKKAEQKIIEQNELLKHIAWQQSHEVRRPVATILGLISLIEDDFKNKAQLSKEYIGYLLVTTQELDNIIRKIVTNTYIFDEGLTV